MKKIKKQDLKPGQPVEKAADMKMPAAFFLAVAACITLIALYGPCGGGGIVKDKPVDKIILPAGMKMSLPYGFTVFKSGYEGSVTYSFVKYEPERGENKFVKVDFTAFKHGKIEDKSGIQSMNETALNSLATSIKLAVNEKEKKDNEKAVNPGRSNFVDLGLYEPHSAGSLMSKGRQWKKHVLYKFEDEDGLKLMKTWTNIYTLHRGYMLVFDFIAVAGMEKDGAVLYAPYEKSLSAAEADIISIMEGLELK